MLKELGTLSHADEAAAMLDTVDADLAGVHFSLPITTWWEPEPRTINLDAILARERDVGPPRTVCLVAESGGLDSVRGRPFETQSDLQRLCMHAGLTLVDLSRPIPLHPVTIPKPWGQEVWFTGIEARGVVNAGSTPLPYLRAAAGSLLDGEAVHARAPVLLKLLVPHADPNFGELYFEVHREKTEVYVVTHVDREAWPDGTGVIRLGFATNLGEVPGTGAFRGRYLDAATTYKTLRDEADALFAERRAALGIPKDAVIDLSTAQAWHANLPAELRSRLSASRTTLAAFSGSHRLTEGDVVCVPPGTPHALQHGVSVIEFQTPHYERSILSFSQQVVTQDGWDTEDALEFVSYGEPPETRIKLLEENGTTRVERIADFDEFEVLRVSLTPGSTYCETSPAYRLAVGLTGEINHGNVDTGHGFYLPADHAQQFINTGSGAASLLIALPRTNASQPQ